MLDLLPDLCDRHFNQLSVMDPIFQSYGKATIFSGQAVTVKCFEDNSLVKELAGTPGEGRILVVDGGGSTRRALLGDMIAENAVKNGWAGFVIYGAIRDVATINTLELGVKAITACPVKTEKRGLGDAGINLHFAGVNIAEGDYIYADLNGVVVAKEPLL
ncbi:putative 4-hydroxy-4-methyl-2-oxoglutarate aldolase [Moritella viscosa]|uniref:4-hydroxy-4-methyl-2-oxoglutarate aldolase n=1 Tax=Moritella viscosa TaxID=80854 RepID=A0A090IGA4_9GAMM|nr:putative 4-hydroxy-4-methyl-2-oxoglutarate aldolase [Moritella viscosa]CED58854.1 regulator of ribonuclease activity A [Moritella viscosa]SGY83988.1 Ribonuclease activity regulator protein RraA [Moritella viscosa]SGY85572.1 Ribonuclease activity regulator protein RraA [Moritella viscosa]SGY85732.1 Ribonuclease activity regulator protein RraA [Moritella viscosa]SHN98169.1 Ribonuclease activity regulator protein RraA [Moritella viscosa]